MNNGIANWLDAEVFDCPNCQNSLFKVGHSPFADDDVFYCSSCPKRVDVGFYDRRRRELSKQIETKTEGRGSLIKEIEYYLKPCKCGGSFHYKSPRRCCYCSEIVVESESSFELYPSYFYNDEDRDPTDEEKEQIERFKNEFIRTENIWK